MKKNDENSLKIYIKEINKIPQMSDEEILECAKNIKNNNDSNAKKKLAEGNLRLVIFIAKQYMQSGVPFEDLIQEGNLGLIKACSKYDYEKGYKFSTYAAYWIKQYIQRYILNKSKDIRIPCYLDEIVQKIESYCERYEKEYGIRPSKKEIATALNLDIKKINKYFNNSYDIVSLNTYVDDNENSTLENSIQDYDYKDPLSNIINDDMKNSINDVLNTLSEREQIIINHRFGINNNNILTLNEIGNKLNLSRERVRQIEKEALKKLRHPARIKMLDQII